MPNKSYSEKDIMSELLTSLKHLKSEYNLLTQEASNPDLYEEVTKLYNEISCMQRTVFNLMSDKGWYKMKPDTATKINQAYNKLCKCESELSK
ncbi:MAG: spore coat protein [Erysipelotrichaceae bacterium]